MENLVLEMREDINKQQDMLTVQKNTLVAAIKALRYELLEKEEKKKVEKDQDEKEEFNAKNVRRKRLPPALTIPEAERHYHQPTAAMPKKHVYLVDGKMTTELGHAAGTQDAA